MLARITWLLRLVAALFAGALQTLRFVSKVPAHRLHSAGKLVRGNAERPKLDHSPLERVADGLYRIEAPFLGAGDAPSEPGALVIYFTGTGETAHAPLPAYRALVGRVPGLSGLAHYVVEAPLSRGAYYGSAAFSSRMWEHVQSIVQRHSGPFVLVGLSRGAIAALDIGTRITEEHGKVAAVLALSAPLRLPPSLPESVVQVAAFEPIVERIADALPHVPQLMARFARAIVRKVHLFLTAVVQVELGMLGDEDFRYAEYDIDLRGPIESSARAVREFRLLVEAPDRELLHFASRVASVGARTARFFAALAWGEHDQWVQAASCEERITAALARENTPEDRVVTCVLRDSSHGLYREHAVPLDAVAALFARVKHEAHLRDETHREQAEKRRLFEQRLRAGDETPRPNED